MKAVWCRALLVALLLGAACGRSAWPVAALPHAKAAAPSFVPTRDVNFTSTREIDRLEVDASGVVWAQSGRQVLCLRNGTWQKLAGTSHEFAVKQQPVRWRGQAVVSGFDGLAIGEGAAKRLVRLPASSGTHISAVLPRGAVLWVALFGDGIWEWNGAKWSQPSALPPQAREITALAQSQDGKQVWLGTRRQGIWQRSGANWQQQLLPGEPFAHNVQSLQSFQGALWASTLEDGLVVRDAKGWRHFGKSTLSSNAPRQLVVFAGKLYVRHSNEVVDCFDGRVWTKNVFPQLPRKQVIALAADSKRLYLGQWGGWSEWDGKTFVHHLRIPELQIVPLLQIFPDPITPGKLWLGTENRGLFEWDSKRQKLRQHDERDGLPDDWITSLNRNGSTLFAGTFYGGIAWQAEGEHNWHHAPALKRLGITAVVSDGPQDTLIATRYGIFRYVAGQVLAWNSGLAASEREIQALLWTKAGLWIGTRDGLLFRTRATLNATPAVSP